MLGSALLCSVANCSSLRLRSEREMMLLLTRAMISSTTVMSLAWLATGAGTAAGGETVPEGSAACDCCPTNKGAPRRNVNRTNADFFINNLVMPGQLDRSLTRHLCGC